MKIADCTIYKANKSDTITEYKVKHNQRIQEHLVKYEASTTWWNAVRGVHGSGWVGLRRFFYLTHHGGSKKIQPNSTHHRSPTQPNPTHMGRVEPMGLTTFFFSLLLN